MEHRMGLGQRSRTRVPAGACDDCQIEQELFKDLVGPQCPHRPSAARHHTHSR